jgi:hypothetical protein
MSLKGERAGGGATGGGVTLYDKRRSSANQGGGDDEIIIFGVAGFGLFRSGHNITDTKIMGTFNGFTNLK